MAQLHMEDAVCTSVQEALHIVDVDATATTLHLYGGHDQVAGQHGTFSQSAGAPLAFYVQTQQPDGSWSWHAAPWQDVADLQLKNGESLLVALGQYSESQVKTMQDSISAPVSRGR